MVAQAALLEWKGGDGVWSATAPTASPWKNNGVYTNDAAVIMGDIDGHAPQTVTIDGVVSPTIVMVQANDTDYVWNAAEGGGSLEGTANLEKTGNGTLTINTDNTGYSGKIILGGGLVEIQNAGALGTGDIVFNGGALKYGTGITTDISGQLKTDALASNAILVDTNGNAVTWASLAGWAGTLTRSGEGSLMLGAGTYEGS